MEEDLSSKAPVTRLRRRLSVEQSEESKSPAPSTPTKKRGARAAKPQLELIEENASVAEKITPRRATRRSIARDTVEEEKPPTPSRRSTRIRSNTSLVLETTQSIDSPRSKRATRRTSLVGSDNEAPITPARTRKTRKDSVPIEKPGDTTIITESISEEPEVNISQSKSLKTPETSRDSNISPNSQRKSTRLLAKQSPVTNSDSKLNDSLNNKANESENKNKNKSVHNKKRTSSTHDQSIESNEDKENRNNLSSSSRDLIDKVEAKSPKVTTNKLNNSIAAIHDTSLTKSKRNRTKSWTTLSASPSKETNFFSDSESAKKKVKSKLNSSKVALEADILNTSGKKDIEAGLNSSKSKKRHSLKSNQENDQNLNDLVTQKIEANNQDLVHNKNSDEILEESQVDTTDSKSLFEKPPALLQSKVFIEDSDSNAEVEPLIGDQCVPVVNHVFVSNSPNLVANVLSSEEQADSATIVKTNQSIEPMDIDETMPENVVLNDSDQLDSSVDSATKNKRKSSILNKSATELNESRRKSSISKLSEDNSANKSKDQSSLTNTVAEETNESTSNSKTSKRKSTSFCLAEKSTTGTNVSNTSLNGSKRKSSSISLTEDINKINHEIESKQKLSESISENNADKTANESKRKLSNVSSIAEIMEPLTVSSKDITVVDDGSLDTEKQSNKSKRKSSLSSITENTSLEHNKSVDKSKRKSLMQSNLEDSIKSNNENKSTLLLSQINDGAHTPKDFKKNKSLNISTEERKLNNKHLSVISTSTPLLDKTTSKATKKHGVNISDIITKEEKSSETNKSSSQDISKNSSEDIEESADDDDESSEAGSGLIIDEAEEAGDDYESGDSQDEDERQYEKENEIVERGETLTSDEDISNDSDYEKDSFIVSSDEEDNDLLDGSGDDLSMSDNELSMSMKSKKKYNERKLAEQKQASREMYNSRHKLNGSSKNVLKNKSKLDSILLESDDDADKSKTKKSKRLRLDSSHETSAINSDPNDTITMKKKKVKRLSESVLENADDEKEITVCADIVADLDPLVGNIKQEPKSARQSLNISTIPFNCVDDVENVQVDENATIVNATQLQEDPLADDDSESSGNEEIIENYDNLLNNLNNKKTTVNTSLNIDKKSKKQIKEPIVDELNLSMPKKSKKNKSEVAKETKIPLITSSLLHDQEASSDSIDMKLLFAEDSNDSEDKQKNNEYGGEDFIPIKSSEPQTDLLRKDNQQKINVSLNTSVKSKKNKNNSLSEEVAQSSYKMEKLLNASLNVSGKKNKQNHSVLETVSSDNDTTLNKSLNKSLKKKNSSLSEDANEVAFNTSVTASGKKKKNSKSISEEITETPDLDTPLNKSLNKSLKKKNSSLSEDVNEVASNTSVTASGKKKKNNKSISEEITETPELDTSKDNKNKSLNTSVKNRNNSISEDDNASKANTSVTASAKKKKKHNKSITDGLSANPKLDDVQQLNESLNISVKSKKSKKHSISEEITTTTVDVTDGAEVIDIAADNNDDDDMPEEVPYKSEKNNAVDTESHQTAVETKVPGKKKRNRRKKKNASQQEIQSNDNVTPETKETVPTEEKPSPPIDQVPDNVKESKGKKSKKRKRELVAASSTENAAEEEVPVNQTISESAVKGSKKKKQKLSETSSVAVPQYKPTEPTVQKEKKKRKREDETETEVAKVRNRNNSDKGIPRLPSDIINQLTEKPKKDMINAKRAKLLATTDFEVKTDRRNKGANKEDIETVFLNGESSSKTKLFAKNKQKFVPFAPVFTTSGSGFTTNFKVSVIPKETKFAAVAKPDEISNFKQDYLSKKLKKLTTDHMSRRPRSARLSKF